MLKQASDRIGKKSYTYDHSGGIIFIKKPSGDGLPGDFNVTKISKKSLIPVPVVANKKKENIEEILDKYFDKNKVEIKEPPKGKEKEIKAPKNYKGMDNKTTPGGSFFEEMTPALGVLVKEGMKNKGGKQIKKGTTRTEYFMSNSKSMITLPSIVDK